MTPQEIFDTVSDHLFAQGAPSRQENEEGGITCAYRGNDGRKCAIGVLIPDNIYDPVMDVQGMSVNGLLYTYKNLPDFFYNNAPLLNALQRAHDSISGHNYYINSSGDLIDDAYSTVFSRLTGPRLLDVGRKFNLDTSKVEARITQASNLPNHSNGPPDSPTTQG